MNELKQLSSEQLNSFDTEYVNGILWDRVVNFIDRDFGDKAFTFLDIGGGNGVFTDRLLDKYPKSQAILLDNATNLIEINKHNPRKKIILDSAENLEIYLKENHVDLIFINWVLHHLVSDSYSKTRHNVLNILKTVKNNPNVKYFAVFENMYNGILFDNLPSKIIFYLTSLKSIKAIVRRMGANTAGVGVAFLSKKTWTNIFTNVFGKNSFEVVDFESWKIPFLRQLFLHIKTTNMSLFWISLKK